MATSYVAVGSPVNMIADSLTCRRQEKPHKHRGFTPWSAQAVGRRDMTESRRVAVAVEQASFHERGGDMPPAARGGQAKPRAR